MKIVTAYLDKGNELHTTALSATLSDLGDILAPTCEGMSNSVAHTLMDNRKKIEALWKEHDEAVRLNPVVNTASKPLPDENMLAYDKAHAGK